jgi:glutaredoxin
MADRVTNIAERSLYTSRPAVCKNSTALSRAAAARGGGSAAQIELDRVGMDQGGNQMTDEHNERLDNAEIVGKDVYPLPVFVYGRAECEDTQKVRDRLQEFQISFVEINIDEDESGRRYVERVNHGERLTPTLVFGNQEFIVVQPNRLELDQALRRAGYAI